MSARQTWTTAPISPTCEVMTGPIKNGELPPESMCGAATSYAYPCMNTGWMALCERHAQKHLCDGGTRLVEELIDEGETWDFGDKP